MQSQFTREFVNDICLFCNNNVIVIRKGRRVKESFNIFVKHTSLLSLVIFLIKIIFFRIEKRIIDVFHFNIIYFLFVVDIEVM